MMATKLRISHVILTALSFCLTSQSTSGQWKRHVIDDSSRGADGVRLADVNGDGLMDIATGWEEGGIIRVYLNPGHAKSKTNWPAVTVGEVKSAEDAVFVDLDGDGAIDVVSSCEGNTKTMYVHWAPKDPAKYLDPTAWTTEPIPATKGKQMWMYALPMQVDGKHGIDLIVSSKGSNACIGWLESPENPRDLQAWKLHRIRDAGWIMSLIATDIDGDGTDDLLFSDRRGKTSGTYWLKLTDRANTRNPQAWKEHTIGAVGQEVMFMAHDVFTGKGRQVIAAVKPNIIKWFEPPVKMDQTWKAHRILCNDTDRFGSVKAVQAGDMTGNGKMELVITCEGASGNKAGVYMLAPPALANDQPRYIDISGAQGVKFDRIELLDLDGDGDLDVLTCEEQSRLGVIWYENPAK